MAARAQNKFTRYADQLGGLLCDAPKGLDRFGLSAPAPIAFKELGLTAEAVVAAAQSL
mgnify:CR=1 FL=1